MRASPREEQLTSSSPVTIHGENIDKHSTRNREELPLCRINEQIDEANCNSEIRNGRCGRHVKSANSLHMQAARARAADTASVGWDVDKSVFDLVGCLWLRIRATDVEITGVAHRCRSNTGALIPFGIYGRQLVSRVVRGLWKRTGRCDNQCLVVIWPLR